MSSNALLWPSQGTIPERRLDKYKWLRLPSQGIGGAIPIEGDRPLLALFPPIGDDSFQFFKFYQVKKGQVVTTQTDMPLPITDTLGPGILQIASGFDIRAFDSNGNQLDYDVESVNITTGNIVVWVNVSTVKDGEFIQLAFGNPTASNGSNADAVWIDYNAVYHLNQTSFGSLSTRDSTANNLNGTPQNMALVNQVPGQIDGSLEFNGTDEFVVMSDSPELDFPSGGWTVSAWIKPTSAGRQYIVGKQRATAPFPGWAFIFSNDGSDRKLFVPMRGQVGQGFNLIRGTQQISLNELHHVVFTYDGSTNASGVRMFIDGIEDITNIENDTLTSGISDGIEFNIGNVGDVAGGPSTFEGIIDEVNISASERSPDFINTSFNSQKDNDAFWFRTKLLENDVDNLLANEAEDVIVAVGQP